MTKKAKFRLFLLFLVYPFVVGIAFVIEYLPKYLNEPKPEESLAVVWDINLNTPIISTPLIQENVMYVRDKNYITAVDLNSRTDIWRIQISGDTDNCSPAINKDYILIPGSKGEILSVNIHNGEQLWLNLLSSPLGKETVEDIMLSETIAFVARLSEYFYALDLHNGDILWKEAVPDRAALYVNIYDRMVILTGGDEIKAFTQTNGETLWTVKLDDNGRSSKPLIIDDILYASSSTRDSQKFLAVDVKSGKVIWEKSLPFIGVECLIGKDNMVIAAGNGLAMLRNQALLWSNYRIVNLTCPIYDQKYIYVRKRVGDLYIYDITDGSLLSKYKISHKTPYSSIHSVDPVKYGEYIIVPMDKSKLSAIKRED